MDTISYVKLFVRASENKVAQGRKLCDNESSKRNIERIIMKTARFPIGLTFSRKRFPKAKEFTEYRIDDIAITTSVKTGEVFRIEYSISHEYFGQRISELVVDPTIARSLTVEQLKEFIK
jgi:hypothetical protein